MTTEASNHTVEPADIRVVSGSPTAAEVAAITAVLHAVLDELAANEATRAKPTTSAWQRSQRPLRASLHPDPGEWRSFWA